MSSVLKTLLTPQEYLARERKAEFKSEYYRGEMFAMAGASWEHTLIKVQAAKYGISMKKYLLKAVLFDKLIDDSGVEPEHK